MNNLSFRQIPEDYQRLLNNIHDKTIQKLYYKPNFNYFYYSLRNFECNKENLHSFKSFFLDFCKKYRFITFQFSNICKDIQNLHDLSSTKIDIIFVIEDSCIIIEQIDQNLIFEIISEIKKIEKIAILNTSINIDILPGNIEEIETKEEICSFLTNFQIEISNNLFIKNTIFSMVGFLIRKFFYPTNYFKDPSFFNFNNRSYSNEPKSNELINDFLFSDSELISNDFSLNTQIKEDCDVNQPKEFHRKDFIILKTFKVNEVAAFYLAIHIESLFIFLLKELNETEKCINIQHEIDFCLKNSHRCMTHFYGFLKKGNDIIGFVYEFLSNGSLSSYILKDKANEIFLLSTVIRLFECIKYLNSQSLIHRDIKPENILLNHDFIPFISDFETIRQPIIDENNLTFDKMTNDIGSYPYLSPEQFSGGFISYPTDIFSFGAVIYFLFEKKNIDFSKDNKLSFSMKENDVIPKMTKGSQYIQNLYESCVKYKKEERLKINDIEDILIQEVQNHQYNLNELNNITKEDINHYFLENILLLQNKGKDTINQFINNFCSFHCSFLKMNNLDDSYFYLHLGDIYYYEKGISQDFEIAKKYYELSSNKENQFALKRLANLYTKRLLDEHNFPKISAYFDSSESLNNTNSLSNYGAFRFKMLGDLYSKGIGVDQDYSKAINYYDLAGNLNNAEAYVRLGDLYENGEGVEQDYSKAIRYYKYAADLNSSDAFYRLGDLYAFGRGVEKDYSFAVKYYKLADKKEDSLFNKGKFNDDKYSFNSLFTNSFSPISLSQPKFVHNEKPLFNIYDRNNERDNYIIQKNKIDVLLDVGDRVFYGKGYNKSFVKAKECFDLASSKGSEKANCKLGVFYANGYGVQQDYAKAKHYFDLAINCNNSDAINNLGVLYENGLDGKKDYKMANYYYTKASKLGNSFSFINLGLIQLYGLIEPKNILLSKVYFRMSANYNNSYAYLYLGLLYYDSFYQGTINYTLAKEYFELSANLNNSNAFNYLGIIYENGYGVDKNYSKSKHYYELSAQLNNPEAYYNLGGLYEKGKGVEKSYSKALFLYEMSANRNYSAAFFRLAYLYSKGDIFPIDFNKSIFFYSKCANIEEDKDVFLFSNDHLLSIKYKRNIYRYRSINDLSLIYFFTEFKNFEKAINNLKQAAFSEYPFAQNNYGLFLQFYLNKLEDAEYMYLRSSKNNFALADYNLGYLYENNNIEKSIKYYIQSSEHEDCPLMYRGHQHFDKRLQVSKTLIICLANLKLTKHFFLQSNYEEAKKYFIKAFAKLVIDNKKMIYKFKFKIKSEITKDFFHYLKDHIFNFPLFNLANLPDIKIDHNNTSDEDNTLCERKIFDFNKENNNFNYLKNHISKEKDLNYNNYTEYDLGHINNNELNRILYEPGILFDFIMGDESLKNLFIQEIQEIVEVFHSILYNRKYFNIIFGRISFDKKNEKQIKNNYPFRQNINQNFYDGFEITI